MMEIPKREYSTEFKELAVKRVKGGQYATNYLHPRGASSYSQLEVYGQGVNRAGCACAPPPW
jgi:hypothetical protein